MLYCRSKRESKQRKANPVFTEGLGGDGGCKYGTRGGLWHPPELALFLPWASTAARGSVVTLSTWAQHWQPGSVPRAQSLQRGSSLLGGGCETGSAAASMAFCGSAVSFWGSCWLEEGLEKSSAGCALFSSQEPEGAAWVTSWCWEQRRVVVSPRHSSTL